MQDFDKLRSAAVQSIMLRHTAQVVPYLTSSLQGQELPLGLKLVVVDWLMAAARELSDIPELKPSEDAIDDVEPTNSLTPSSQNVRIKRPTVLANSKKRTRYFRNDFGPVASLFIYPLVNILGRAWSNTPHESSVALLSGAADQFNLISEMFEPPSSRPPSNSSSSTATTSTEGLQLSKTKDNALSHLDGVDALLPSQCLVALGLFARCAVNTVEQR